MLLKIVNFLEGRTDLEMAYAFGEYISEIPNELDISYPCRFCFLSMKVYVINFRLFSRLL